MLYYIQPCLKKKPQEVKWRLLYSIFLTAFMISAPLTYCSAGVWLSLNL